MTFEGKVGLVTGAGRGIGREAALGFAARGAAVGVLDIREEDARDTVAAIEASGGRALPLAVDVADEDSVGTAVTAVAEAFGGLDFAHNNAGVTGEPATRLHEMTTAEWDRIVAINLTGTYNCMKYELALLEERGGGAIVNTSSNAGLYGIPGMPAYVASKHGVVGISKSAAVDYGPKGIRVVALCPGSTATPMMKEFTAGTDGAARRAQAIPLGRLAEPEEIAAAAVWLCSDAARFVTGVFLSVDGGRRV